MIRIRRLFSTAWPADRERVEQVQEIFRQNFSAVNEYAQKIPRLLDQPFEFGYRAVLLISETGLGKVTGFSLFLHLPEIDSSLLDFLAVRGDIRGSGLGGALYDATREHLQGIRSRGLYLESLPDDPAQVKDPAELAENRRRLRFYEQHGARPLAGTGYETPIGDSPAPLLLFDDLGRQEPLGRAECRAAIRLILRRKYAQLVGPDYIERVVESILDDPVRFREPLSPKNHEASRPIRPGKLEKTFALVLARSHVIHHVRERGYVERPARIGALADGLATMGLFQEVPLRHWKEEHIRAVHDGGFVTYLKNVCEKLHPRRPVYPYVFPIRRPDRRPKDLALRAGYYCIDTFTPLTSDSYKAARAAVDAALTAAEELRRGRRVAYALCRPPGHHAERRVFGGFCYFNNAAIAAHYLSSAGRVAVLDIDFHHGNGTQDIFYGRSDVLTLSIHGHPNHAYPYFSGFADELGEGEGKGFNRNYPLPEGAGEELYLAALERACAAILAFKPHFLVVPLGLDIIKADPTGSFVLRPTALEKIGRRLASLDRPTLVVQEGGYHLRNLRRGGVAFFSGMAGALQDRYS